MNDTSIYWLTRLLLQRGLGLIYLMGFLVALNQFRPLCGDRGLLPARDYMRLVPFRQSPSIFYFIGGDRAYAVCAWIGTVLSILVLTGIAEAHGVAVSMTAWFLLWALYLSYVNIGQTFYAFGWESLLLEAGFLAIFLGPAGMQPSWVVIWLFRWLAFRVMFGAGMIKMRGDPCWRDLTCLDYHFETQPMPNPLSRLFHRLPEPVHRCGVAFNHVAELALPVLFFAPQPVAGIAGIGSVLFLLSIIISGNFAWLNWLAAILCLSTIDQSLLSPLLSIHSPSLLPPPPLFQAAVWGLALLVALKSIEPARNLLSRGQIMNTSFDPFHLVNTYGAFGSITRERFEIVLEGTDEETVTATTRWKEYEFRGKPGNPARMPPVIAPYHLRLDWLMWFAAMPSRYLPVWLIHLAAKLLEGDRGALRLMKENPFPQRPPRFVRGLYYRYRFGKKRWWDRELIGTYLPPLSLHDGTMKAIMDAYGWEE